MTLHPPSPPVFAPRRGRAFVGLLLAATLMGAAPEPTSPDDPVEAFARALLASRPLEGVVDKPSEEFLKHRSEALEGAARKVRNLGDLKRVLLMQEWGRADPLLAEVDADVRAKLIGRFLDDVRKVISRGDRLRKIAASNLVTDLFSEARGKGTESSASSRTDIGMGGMKDPKGGLPPTRTLGYDSRSELRGRLQELARDFAGVATDASSPPDVRAAAARALGACEGDVPLTIATLKKLMQDDNVTVRRSAAEGLGTLLDVAAQSGKAAGAGITPAQLRRNPLPAVVAAAPVLASGLTDRDQLVRRLTANACRKGSSALVDVAGMPPLTLSPEMRKRLQVSVPLSEKERTETFATARVDVLAKLEGLMPVVQAFRAQAPALREAVLDSDPAVRLEMVQVLQDLADTSLKLRPYFQLVEATEPPSKAPRPDKPELPERPEKPIKPDDKDKKGPKLGRKSNLRPGSTGVVRAGGLEACEGPAALGAPVKLVSRQVPEGPASLGAPVKAAGRQADGPAVLGAPVKVTRHESADGPATLGAPIKVAPHEVPEEGPMPEGPMPVGPLPVRPDADHREDAPAVPELPAHLRPWKAAPAAFQADLPGGPKAKVKDDLAGPLTDALEKTRRALIRDLFDSTVRVRLAAMDALGMMGPDAAPAIPALIQNLGHSNPFVRWSAARVLGGLAPREPATVVPALAHLVNCQEDISVRLAVFHALGAYGPAAIEAVPVLGKAIDESDVEARLAVLLALERIGPKAGAKALPAIAWGLKDRNPQVRAGAARALGRFGPAAREALPALRAALKDSSEDVRRAVSEAILAIDLP